MDRFIKMNWMINAITVALMVTGCTTQQLYNTGQSWQRNQCQRIVDQLDRQQCLSNTNTPYETYKRQSDQIDTKK